MTPDLSAFLLMTRLRSESVYTHCNINTIMNTNPGVLDAHAAPSAVAPAASKYAAFAGSAGTVVEPHSLSSPMSAAADVDTSYGAHRLQVSRPAAGEASPS